MGRNLDRLIEIGVGPTAPADRRVVPDTALGRELAELLDRSNGLTAFESALVVRGTGAGPAGLATWNAPTTWRDSYDGMADDVFFFAEDVFGGQFGLTDGAVISFDPETGDREDVAGTVEGWAGVILDDHEVQTGYPLAARWQRMHGPLPAGVRLVPRTLFVLGGEFTVENCAAVPDVRGMRFRGDVAVQIRDVPDGGRITVELVD